MKKHKKKILRWFVFALIGVVLGVSVYRWNAENLLGNKLPMPMGYGASIVLTGSMEPELSANDLVIVKDTDDIAVNDIIVFQDGNSLVIHRVVEINGDEIITKGDANNTNDSPISIQDVKGKMVFAISSVGVVVEVLRQPTVIFIVLIMAFLLTELSYRKEKDKDSEELDLLKAEIRKLLDEAKNENQN